MPRDLTGDTRSSLARAPRHAARRARHYVSGEHLTAALVSALHPGPGRASALVPLRRAHPGIFDDALWAVINKAKRRKS